MIDRSSEILEAIGEIRDLLRLVAEPAIAKRDEKQRAALSQIVGKSAAKAKAVMLMDGNSNQKGIIDDCGINQGDLSVLVKDLAAADLIAGDGKRPKLAVSIPQDFFDSSKGGSND